MDITEIFKDPIIFFPSKVFNNKKNLYAIIKLLVYCSIILLLFGRINLMIYMMIIVIIIYVIGNQMIDTVTDVNNEKYENNVICRKSTIDNPMANILLYMTDHDMDLKKCNNIRDEDDKLEYNVYHDSRDVFNKKNSMRPFITMPSQIYPNDRTNFLKYIYNIRSECKMEGKECAYYDDARYTKNEYNEHKD